MVGRFTSRSAFTVWWSIHTYTNPGFKPSRHHSSYFMYDCLFLQNESRSAAGRLTARRRRQDTISAWSFRLEVLMERTSSSFWVSQESNKHWEERRGKESEGKKGKEEDRKEEKRREGKGREMRRQEEREIFPCGRRCTRSHCLLLLQTAPDCSILLRPIVCDSISTSARDFNVNVSVISVRTVHLQQEPAVILEQAFSPRTEENWIQCISWCFE